MGLNFEFCIVDLLSAISYLMPRAVINSNCEPFCTNMSLYTALIGNSPIQLDKFGDYLYQIIIDIKDRLNIPFEGTMFPHGCLSDTAVYFEKSTLGNVE
jgi:hypothetical protein